MEKETIRQLLDNNTTLVKSNNTAVETSREAIHIIKEQFVKIDAFSKICGETHSYLNIKSNKTWEEEHLCRKLYGQITGVETKKKG